MGRRHSLTSRFLFSFALGLGLGACDKDDASDSEGSSDSDTDDSGDASTTGVGTSSTTGNASQGATSSTSSTGNDSATTSTSGESESESDPGTESEAGSDSEGTDGSTGGETDTDDGMVDCIELDEEACGLEEACAPIVGEIVGPQGEAYCYSIESTFLECRSVDENCAAVEVFACATGEVVSTYHFADTCIPEGWQGSCPFIDPTPGECLPV